MLERLKRPGYWILLLAAITIVSFQRFEHNEKVAEEETMLQIYRAYGEGLFADLRERNLLELQRRFGREAERKLDLEDIALFIDTLRIDKGAKVNWKNVEEREGNITIAGELEADRNLSYPIEMMVVRRGGQLLLRKIRVGENALKPKETGFPFVEPREWNATVVPKKQEGS